MPGFSLDWTRSVCKHLSRDSGCDIHLVFSWLQKKHLPKGKLCGINADLPLECKNNFQSAIVFGYMQRVFVVPKERKICTNEKKSCRNVQIILLY